MIYSGIYMIVNKINGKRYVGSAVNLYRRWKDHLKVLRKGIHHSPYFQHAFNKHGEENFEFIIMKVIKDLTQLVPKEQTWLDFYKSYDSEYGYNICRVAGSTLGFKYSEESKKKLSILMTGENHHSWGKPRSEETKQRIRASNLGKKRSAETIKNIRIASGKRKHSEKSKQLMRIVNRGENNGMYGKKHSEKTKDRMRKPKSEKAKENMRKPKSEEGKENIKLAQIERWRKYREGVASVK